jgi:hypothetical protein
LQIALSVPGLLDWLGSFAMPRAWLRGVSPRLASLTQLPENWDSHGARRVNGANVTAALVLLHKLMSRRTPLPTIVPTADGSLQLEWHEGGVDLEIRIASNGHHQASVEDESGRIAEWEGPVNENLPRVKQAIEQLAKRRA